MREGTMPKECSSEREALSVENIDLRMLSLLKAMA
jgi:hypothetical protein